MQMLLVIRYHTTTCIHSSQYVPLGPVQRASERNTTGFHKSNAPGKHDVLYTDADRMVLVHGSQMASQRTVDIP